ncbi:autoinducer binding domain-containing protein [Pseudomonas sp. CVAP|uniref:autoinducer binding domain-containing protein n=1 Tax=Pseudomonas sp. CVAP\|nr:autoinducer binding domain-containing protein [Pseudomonas sp. CVAP\
MKSWQDDLLSLTTPGLSEQHVFDKIKKAALALEFEYCAYGIQIIFPKEKVVMLNNYPARWKSRYASANYITTDPTVAHCKSSQVPLIWKDSIYKNTPALWEEARSAGLRHGWAQSSLDAFGVGGMLTLSRSAQALSKKEIEYSEIRMRWLVSVAHVSLSKIINERFTDTPEIKLTTREKEVLKWTGNGKTSSEISYLLAISENTVNFHIKNTILKLSAANKTAAVVQAFAMGLLN